MVKPTILVIMKKQTFFMGDLATSDTACSGCSLSCILPPTPLTLSDPISLL